MIIGTSKEEIEQLIIECDDEKSDLLSLLSRICVKHKIKMCCFIKDFPQIPPTTFKNRVNSIRKGFGDGKRVFILYFFLFFTFLIFNFF
jgi:hypothetical protein